MSREWYVQVGYKQYGPIPSAQLRQWATERRITPESWVREKGGGQWVAAGKVPGLFSSAVRPPSVPPPLPASEVETSGLDFPSSLGSGTGRSVGASQPVRSVRARKKKEPVGLYISGGVAVALALGAVALWYFGQVKPPAKPAAAQAKTAPLPPLPELPTLPPKPKGPTFVPDGVTEVEKTINGRRVLCLFRAEQRVRRGSIRQSGGMIQQAITEAYAEQDRLEKRKSQAEASGQYDEVLIQDR